MYFANALSVLVLELSTKSVLASSWKNTSVQPCKDVIYQNPFKGHLYDVITLAPALNQLFQE